jgi:hypothetical protein
MIVRAFDVHQDIEKARLGVGLAAEALGIKCNMALQTMWKVDVDGPSDLAAFLEIAREYANANH